MSGRLISKSGFSYPSLDKNRTPAVKVSVTTSNNLTSGGFTLVSFDTEVYDTDEMFTPTSDTITIKTPGIWVWSANAQILSPGANQLGLMRFVLTPATFDMGPISSGPAGYNIQLISAAVDRFAVGDTVKVSVYQESGSNKQAQASIRGVWVAP